MSQYTEVRKKLAEQRRSRKPPKEVMEELKRQKEEIARRKK